MSLSLGTAVELLVCLLLAVTIGYCVVLNRRLTRLRADEANLRATISELITATEIAERAIHGLRATAAEADQTLGKRLRDAERFSAEISREIEEGEVVLSRISRITEAARGPAVPAVPATPSASHELKARAAAAAERLAQMRRTG